MTLKAQLPEEPGNSPLNTQNSCLKKVAESPKFEDLL